MKLLNTNQAAEALGISARRVRALITAGTLPAHPIGREYAIEEKALARVKVYGKPGRPPRHAMNAEERTKQTKGKRK